MRPLTPKENRVLELYAPGRLSYKQIAAELHCSLSTVRTHLRNVFLKTPGAESPRHAAWLRVAQRGPPVSPLNQS